MQLQRSLRTLGCEDISMIVAIDLTESNVRNGIHSNNGISLHDVTYGVDEEKNFYQRAISSVATALLPFDEDKNVPLWGFGDDVTRAHSHSVIGKGEINCADGPDALLAAYVGHIKTVRLSGPTNFAPIVKAAASAAQSANRFHVLIILCDGGVSRECWYETRSAIIDASRTAPLAIVIVGLGDGPWDSMQHLDEWLDESLLDNVHFVEYEAVMKSTPAGCTPNEWFAAQALAELPLQYTQMSDKNVFRTAADPKPLALSHRRSSSRRY